MSSALFVAAIRIAGIGLTAGTMYWFTKRRIARSTDSDPIREYLDRTGGTQSQDEPRP